MSDKELTRRFHFTLGPVQGFVSQARRTRDFWAGSFLLSYLSTMAMCAVESAVESAGSKIHFPDVKTDPLMQRLRGEGGSPKIGTVPNRFVAKVPDGFDGEKVVEAVQAEWKRIADAVWELDLKNIAGRKLWNSQIESFWDMSWALTEDASDSTLLDRRKNWRTHYLPEHRQEGDKCTVMGEWQELSGVEAPGAHGQKEFWGRVRKGKGLDLREGERLCAIAYVKRRFVHVWNNKSMPREQQHLALHSGWKLPTSVPSTSYMAAVHLLEKLIETKPDSSKITGLCDAARKAHALGEKLTRIHCISTALEGSRLDGCIADIDGRLLFDNELRQLEESKKEKGGEITRQQAKTIRDVRKALIASVQQQKPDFPKEPSPFYAVLFMDGDSLGKHMSDPNKQQAISAALGRFIRGRADAVKGVPDIVEKNNGFLVYAGGDDVLAILPLEDALKCALDVRQAYMDAFAEQDEVKEYSISAAIEFAHMKLPLTAILKDAHQLLDGVAKEQTGRDAIACRVWKPGGEQLTWSMKWGKGEVARLGELVGKFQKAEEGEPGHASKPLYRIRERLKMLEGVKVFEKKEDVETHIKAHPDSVALTEDEMKNLLVAEYVTSGVLDKEDKRKGTAERRVGDMLPLCKKPDGSYGAEAAILMRFLAQKGAER